MEIERIACLGRIWMHRGLAPNNVSKVSAQVHPGWDPKIKGSQ